jgi:hypothetical protein
MLQLSQAKQLASEFAATTLDDPAAQARSERLGLRISRSASSERRGRRTLPRWWPGGDPRARVGEARLAIDRDLPGSMKVVERCCEDARQRRSARAQVDLLLARNEREPAKQTLAQIIRSSRGTSRRATRSSPC